MHDHKGELTVLWCCAGCADDWMAFINAAWQSENECAVTHVSERERGIIAASEDAPLDSTWRSWLLPELAYLPAQGRC
jgi:hypothetical protein